TILLILSFCSLLFSSTRSHRDLHSFPTRRSSDLVLFSSMYGMVSPDPEIYELPMEANPIEYGVGKAGIVQMTKYLAVHWAQKGRSEEHTSELQSRENLVCRLLLEKKKKIKKRKI